MFNFLKSKKPEVPPHPAAEPRYNMPINEENLKTLFSDCTDFEIRTVLLGGNKRNQAALCFVDGLVSGETISDKILRPLTTDVRFFEAVEPAKAIELMEGGVVYNHSVKYRDSMDDLVSDLLNGFCAVVFDTEGKALSFETRSGDKRSIGEPSSERVLKGAKDGFVETLRANSTLIRRKIKTTDLKMKDTTVGRRTKTAVNIIYIQNLTNPELVAEVEKRLDKIDIDGLLAAANVEEYITDNPNTPFPQLIYTERADKFCMNILEGRVGLIIDGLPYGYVLPGTFSQFMKVPDDNANHFLTASYLTLLRYFCLAVTLLLPAFYVAIAMYHQEMLPTKFLMSIIESKKDVPFSTATEVLGMLIAFEALQEAGLRLPGPVGQTVSIIGGLIVGQSAVEAKVMSPVVVVIVAVAGITGYTTPNQDMASAVRIIRFLLVLAAIIAGMFGIAVGGVLVIYHLSTLETFGTPYLMPFVDSGGRELWNAIFRPALRKSKYREDGLNTVNKRNQG